MSANATESPDAPQPVLGEILATKLAPPPVRAGYVPRQRLLDALASGRDRRLTLVAAPTGYGKTMLVAAWCAELAQLDERVISWLTLSPAENDPAALTRYLIGALLPAGAGIGERAESMLGVPGASPIAWMRSLVNDLATTEAEITLVLDGYEMLTEPACHELLQVLLDHAPATLHLLVCTRAEPPFTLGSLRAAGQLAEIRAPELRFSEAEAAQLLVEEERLDLEPAAVVSLTARTEGWPAALYLAALWLRGRADPAGDVERFAGDNRHLVDYLSEAVLDRLDDDVREFLLSSSIVDRLCTSLCLAITGRPAAGVLEAIERSNLFLVPLDDSRKWYRYHHLFAGMLRSELERRHPERVAELHRRAGAWYRSAGMVPEAVDQATAAGDYADAAALISEFWLEIGRWGQEATIRRWLDAFGSDELQRYPELGLVGGVLTGISGRSEIEFRGWLELAERGLAPGAGSLIAGTTSLEAGVNLLRATFGYRNIPETTAAAARSARVESESNGVFRVVALANLAFLLYLSGDPAGSRQALSQAMRDPLAERRPYGFITALTTSALISLDEGDAGLGERTARQALEYAAAAGLTDNQVAGLAHAALGRALMAAGRLASARTELEHAVTRLRGGVTPARHAYALLCAAPVIQAGGDLPGALALVDEAERLLASFEDAGILTALLRDVQRRLSLARRRRREPDPTALTEAELAVLRLLPTPRSQRQIADELSISINTVKTHISSIYRKLGVRSRDAAVARAGGLSLL